MARGHIYSTMTRQNAANLLESLAKEHLLKNPNAIIDSDKSIQAFGCYTITKTKFGYNIYKNRVKINQLGLKKSALCWCIADKYGVCALANDINQFDKELDRRYSEIEYYKHVLKLNDDRKSIMLNRLSDSLVKANHIKNQLDKCVNRAKYWQHKGFNNETARLGFKPQDSTIPKGI